MRMSIRGKQSGMTFFEVIVVMGIFAMVGGFALFVSMETFRGSNFRSDRDLLVATLQRARAQSMNNVCLGTCTDGKPHGVKILPDNTLVIFQGATYETRDTSVDAVFTMNTATMTGTDEFVFSQLSGTSTAAEVALTDPSGRISTTTVNVEGKISWTH